MFNGNEIGFVKLLLIKWGLGVWGLCKKHALRKGVAPNVDVGDAETKRRRRVSLRG